MNGFKAAESSLKGVSRCSAATHWVSALPTMQNNNLFFFPPVILRELWNEWLQGSREQLEGCFQMFGSDSLGIGIANHAKQQPFFFPPVIFRELWNEWLRGSREQLEECFLIFGSD